MNEYLNPQKTGWSVCLCIFQSDIYARIAEEAKGIYIYKKSKPVGQRLEARIPRSSAKRMVLQFATISHGEVGHPCAEGVS